LRSQNTIDQISRPAAGSFHFFIVIEFQCDQVCIVHFGIYIRQGRETTVCDVGEAQGRMAEFEIEDKAVSCWCIVRQWNRFDHEFRQHFETLLSVMADEVFSSEPLIAVPGIEAITVFRSADQCDVGLVHSVQHGALEMIIVGVG